MLVSSSAGFVLVELPELGSGKIDGGGEMLPGDVGLVPLGGDDGGRVTPDGGVLSFGKASDGGELNPFVPLLGVPNSIFGGISSFASTDGLDFDGDGTTELGEGSPFVAGVGSADLEDRGGGRLSTDGTSVGVN